MARIYKVKNAPKAVLAWHEKNMPGCEYNFYWYKAPEGKTYASFTMKDGKLWSNHPQATEQWFANA